MDMTLGEMVSYREKLSNIISDYKWLLDKLKEDKYFNNLTSQKKMATYINHDYRLGLAMSELLIDLYLQIKKEGI